MKVFTVHAPPDVRDDGESFHFVKDGFCWPALFVPVLWILWHRMWLTLVWYIAYVLALAWIGRLLGADAAAVVALLGAILFALEANNIRRASLASRGWADIGATYGANLEEAEIRFFQARAAAIPPPATAVQAQPQATVIRPFYPPLRDRGGEETVIGLFPEPER